MKEKGKSCFGGVMLLTLSAAAAKIFGVLYKIPLYAIIGEEGVGYFNSAYVIYTFFYVFTTSGLPVGLSILVSCAAGEKEKRMWLRKALLVFGSAGGFFCAAMMLFPGKLSAAVGNPGAKQSIFVLGPALLFVCLEGAVRGYFQGKKNMIPTAVSQVIEAVCKTGLGLVGAYAAVKSGRGCATAAAWGLFGISFGGFISLCFLFAAVFFDRKKYRADNGNGLIPNKPTAARLLAVVVPVSAAAAVMSVSSLIDLTVVMHRLTDVGYTVGEANRIYGNYSGLAQPVFHLPSMLCAPLASALTPYLSAAASDGRRAEFALLCRTATRMALLLTLPFFAGYAALPKELLSLLFDAASAAKAAPLLALLSPGVCFVSLSTVFGAILQASGRRFLPVAAIGAGAAVKTVSAYILIGKYGASGACVGTVLCYLTAACIGFAAVHKDLRGSKTVLKTLVYPAFATALCAGAAKACALYLPLRVEKVKTLIAVAAAGTVYLAAVLITGCVDGELLSALPFAEKLQKIVTSRILRHGRKTYERKSKGTDQGTLHF